MKTKRITTFLSAVGVLALGSASGAAAQVSARLTDTVAKGAGSINLLKDFSAAQLQKQISSSGKLYFAMDVNEDMSGLESAKSAGVALKDMSLNITTTKGSYAFSRFSTNTMAMLTDGGAGDGEDEKSEGGTRFRSYYTVFGDAGSNDLSSNTKGFKLGQYDSVIALSDVKFDGDILKAQLSVRLLDTGESRDANDNFFDYSGGYEDMALLSPEDAQTLEQAAVGHAAAPAKVTYAREAAVVAVADVSRSTAATPTPAPAPAVPAVQAATPAAAEVPSAAASPTALPAAPAPSSWLLLGLLAALAVSHLSSRATSVRHS